MTLQAIRIGIIADDLTGCADAAAPFALAGATTQALISPIGLQGSTTRVVAVSTNSRADEPATAAGKVAAISEALKSAGVTHLFKKIDSTGMGNIGAEIEALLPQTEASVAIVCPALPDQGRTFVDGLIRVKDTPSAGLDLRGAISQQTDLPIKLVTQPQVQELLKQSTSSARLDHGGKQIWLVDADRNEHLSLIAQLVDQLGDRTLAVGSSGLARALADRWIGQERSPKETDRGLKSSEFFLAIIGSANDVTRQQVRYLHDTYGGSPIELQRGIDLTQYTDPDEPLVILSTWDPARREALETVFDWIRERSPGTVFLSGGDTAHFVCDTAGTSALAIQGEIAPGIPWGIALDGHLKDCHVVTKAGGFGNREVIADLYHRANVTQRDASTLER